MKTKDNKVFKVILNVMLGIIIVIAAIITIVSLNTKEKGVANINGYIPFSIQSSSMEKAIHKGDLIITKKYNSEELKVGDVISFFSLEQNIKIIKTHRIIEIVKDGGMTSYVTKGDNNELPDAVKVAPGDVVARYDGKKIEKVGYVLDFFKSKYGFLFCIILPIFIFFIYQLYTFIELVVEVKKEQAIKEIKEVTKKHN